MIEEQIEEHLPERLIVGDLLVELEVVVDHVLQLVLRGHVEGQAGVAGAVDLNAFLDGVALLDVFLKLLDKDAVVLVEVVAEALVEELQDLRERLRFGL